MTASAPKQNDRSIAVLLLLILLIAPWMGLWNSDRSATAVTFSAANMLLFPFVGLAIVAVEQLVVALVARALGDRVTWVGLGLGPVLLTPKVKLVYVAIRPITLCSFSCIATARPRGQRLRLGLAMLAGTGAMVAIAALVLASSPWELLKQRLANGIAVETLVLIAASLSAFVGGLAGFGALTGRVA